MTREWVTLDTNILVYALDRDAGERHATARELVERAVGWDCVLMLQALAEFFWAVTRKDKMPASDAAAQVKDWQLLFAVHAATPSTLDRAIAGVKDHGLAFWDAMLWACACEASCGLLLSEDLQHGRVLRGVRFHNPFIEPVPMTE